MVQAAYDKRELEGPQLVARQQTTLTSFLDNLSYQNATPAEKLRLAQEGFGSVLAAARASDCG